MSDGGCTSPTTVEGRSLRARRPWRLTAAAALLCGACGGTSEPPSSQPTITIDQGNDQQATVAMMVALAPTVVLRDAMERPLANTRVTFSVTDGGGWVVSDTVVTDAQGRAATSWYLGPRTGAQRLIAAASAGSVEFRATATALIPGQTYVGAQGYIELIAGDLPLIVSAPHGGTLTPAEIPDRTQGTFDRDTNTEELARTIRTTFQTRGGHAPFVIICRLRRIKLDANREIVEAAQGHAGAERAWREYHGFIEAARARVIDDRGSGFYIDLHGHGHTIERLELGYLLTSTDLAGTDAALNAAALVQKSSIRSLVQSSGRTHAELIRGANSLGALFAAQGFRSVPSPAEPNPAGAPFFSGGYNTERHGSSGGGPISGVQIEAHFNGVRDNATSRQRFADALVTVMNDYFARFYGAPLVSGLVDDIAAPSHALQPAHAASTPHYDLLKR